MAKRDYYDILGVNKSSSKEDIKKLVINSFKSSFLNESEKKIWIDEVNNLP